jgi:hypothetical protein
VLIEGIKRVFLRCAWRPTEFEATPACGLFRDTDDDVGFWTIFLHGFFFAHQVESSSRFTGYTGPLHWPKEPKKIKEEKRWFRPAA